MVGWDRSLIGKFFVFMVWEGRWDKFEFLYVDLGINGWGDMYLFWLLVLWIFNICLKLVEMSVSVLGFLESKLVFLCFLFESFCVWLCDWLVKIEVGVSELLRCFRVLERELLKVVDIEEIWVIEWL